MNLLIAEGKDSINHICARVTAMNPTFTVIHLADSAQKARRLMQQNTYDIFICGMRLPDEEGIDLGRWILEQYPEAKLIFISDHAETDDLKAAISMHAFNFILKSENSDDYLEELKETIEKAEDQIQKESLRTKLIGQGQFFSGREESILNMHTLRYLEGKREENGYIRRIIAKNNRYGPGVSDYMPVLVEVQKSEKNLEEIGQTLLKVIYQNILDELFLPDDITAILLLEEEKNDFFLVLCWLKEYRYEKLMLIQKLDELRLKFLEFLQTRIAVYCGDICRPEELPEKSVPLFRSLKDNVRKESKTFNVGMEIKSQTANSFEVQVKTWGELLEKKQFVQFRDSILFYIQEGTTQSYMNTRTMARIHQRVTELLMTYSFQHGIRTDQLFDEENSYLDYMLSWQEMDNFEKNLTHIVNRLIVCSSVQRMENAAEDAKKYIRQNLDRELTVAEVARYVGMNPEYCTRLFKKNTGCNIKEYIVQEKIEAAKELLASTDFPVTMISSQVGYGNYSNFTRCFKRETGMTPVQFRKEKAQKAGDTEE